MQRKILLGAILLALLLMANVAFATAPTVTVLTDGKQMRTFYLDFTTNIDSNCVADTNTLKTTWEDFNGTDHRSTTLIYMTSTAGTNHGTKITAPNGVMSVSYKYCCAQTTYGQTDANSTCGGVSFPLYYGAGSIPLVAGDIIVGIPAEVAGLTVFLGLFVVLAVGMFLFKMSKQ